ncbi:MAG: hypothetical protein HY013_00790 [Candidatus Solibacter usitatus]|nr:hypothetical protein [Candidatus Solibacter usitatus]
MALLLGGIFSLRGETGTNGFKSVTDAPFGAKCDGAADDTAAIQSALNTQNVVRFPPAICVTGPLMVRSNTVLELQPATVLAAKPGYGPTDRLLNLIAVSNITIRANGGAVQMRKSEYTSGEQRHAVFISESKDVRIYDLTAKDSGGDGFLIQGTDGGGGAPSENITLSHCIADNNRRQGLSIVNARNLLVIGGEYRNTSGTPPEAGIDLETDFVTDRMENISLIGVRTSNNRGGGIKFVPKSLPNAPGNVVSVFIQGFQSANDRGGGGLFFTLPPAAAAGHAVTGQIVVQGASIVNPDSAGVQFLRWNASMPRVALNEVTVVNPNVGGTGRFDPGETGWSDAEREIAAHSGFVVAVGPTEPATPLTGSIVFHQCAAVDQRSKPAMQLGFYLHSSSAKGIDALLYNPRAVNYTLSATNSAVNWNRGRGTVRYDPKPVVQPRVNFNIDPFMGYEIAPAAAVELDLGSAAGVQGAEYTIRDTGPGVTVKPRPGDTIDLFGQAPGQAVTVARTGRGLRAVTLQSDGARRWRVDGSTAFYAANGPLYLVGGYGAAPNDPANVTIGSTGASPDVASVAFGNNTGVRMNFGYHAGGAFTPTSAVYDTGRHDVAALQIGGGAVIARFVSATAAWTPASIGDNDVAATTVPVNGCPPGSLVTAGFDSVARHNFILTAHASAANAVSVVALNKTGKAFHPAPGTLRVGCWVL